MGLVMPVHDDDEKAPTDNQLWTPRGGKAVATMGSCQHWSGSLAPCKATEPVKKSHGASKDEQKSVDDLDKYMAAITDPALLHDGQKYQQDLAHGVQSYA